jgi:alcohol dehydrogenase (cytochrome c)
VLALDAETSLPVWRYRRQQKVVNPNVRGNRVSRGVSVLGNRVFLATLDAALVALDARTGRLLWETQVIDTMSGYTITSPPLAFRDKIINGVSRGDFGAYGFIDAYDAATGKRLWRFNTIPGPGEFGHDMERRKLAARRRCPVADRQLRSGFRYALLDRRQSHARL